MRHRRRQWLAVAFLIGFTSVALATVAPEASELTVIQRADRLTVRATNASLSRVLDEIARTTGAEVHGPVPAHEVSASMEGVPLTEALARLLGSENFTLTYSADGKLRAIELLAGPPSWPPAAIERSQPRGGQSQTSQQTYPAAMGRTIPVSRRLGAALGTSNPPAGQVINAAFHQRSAGLRAEAQEAVLAALERDPELEQVFVATLRAIDDRRSHRSSGAGDPAGRRSFSGGSLPARTRTSSGGRPPPC